MYTGFPREQVPTLNWEPVHREAAILRVRHPDRSEDSRHSNADCTPSGFKSHSTGWQGSIRGLPVKTVTIQLLRSCPSRQREGCLNMTRLCALCQTLLTRDNNTREHVIPNALGGRKKVRHFICKRCNDKTGEKWDSEITAQLQPLCTMLNIVRERGDNRSLSVETVAGRKLTWKPDGSLTIARPNFDKRTNNGKTHVAIQARSMDELEGMLIGMTKKKKYSELNVNEVMAEASLTQDYPHDPIHIPFSFGGQLAGRSIVKTCLALAYEAGLTIDDCENAKECLVSGGQLCFGYYNVSDPIVNRPANIPLHCAHVCADPESGQILGYVEYFGFQKMVICLSSDYSGPVREQSYAVNPLTGAGLDIDVDLNLSADDIPAIYDFERWDHEHAKADLGNVLTICREIDRDSAIRRAVEEAIEYACVQMGLQDGDILSDERILEFSNYAFEKIAPVALRLRFGQEFTPGDMRAIAGMLDNSKDLRSAEDD